MFQSSCICPRHRASGLAWRLSRIMLLLWYTISMHSIYFRYKFLVLLLFNSFFLFHLLWRSTFLNVVAMCWFKRVMKGVPIFKNMQYNRALVLHVLLFNSFFLVHLLWRSVRFLHMVVSYRYKVVMLGLYHPFLKYAKQSKSYRCT